MCIYARTLGGTIYHYRDKSDLEADAIIQLANGAWSAVEVKLGGQARIDEDAKQHIGYLFFQRNLLN